MGGGCRGGGGCLGCQTGQGQRRGQGMSGAGEAQRPDSLGDRDSRPWPPPPSDRCVRYPTPPAEFQRPNPQPPSLSPGPWSLGLQPLLPSALGGEGGAAGPHSSPPMLHETPEFGPPDPSSREPRRPHLLFFGPSWSPALWGLRGRGHWLPWCQTVWVCSLTLGGSPGSAGRGRGAQTWAKSRTNPFPGSGLRAPGVRVSTEARRGDLERVLTTPPPSPLCGPRFPQERRAEAAGRCCGPANPEDARLPSARTPSPGPRQPRGMLGARAWAPGQVGGGGGAGAASSLPLPPHLGPARAPAGGSGRPGRREAGCERGRRTRPWAPPPPPFPPASPAPPRLPASPAGRYPGPGPLREPPPPHPQLQTWLRAAARGRERRKEKGGGGGRREARDPGGREGEREREARRETEGEKEAGRWRNGGGRQAGGKSGGRRGE